MLGLVARQVDGLVAGIERRRKEAMHGGDYSRRVPGAWCWVLSAGAWCWVPCASCLVPRASCLVPRAGVRTPIVSRVSRMNNVFSIHSYWSRGGRGVGGPGAVRAGSLVVSVDSFWVVDSRDGNVRLALVRRGRSVPGAALVSR